MLKNDIYVKPSERLHRSFVYLDDELLINSLSAFEAGQIDAVVSKVVDARESGFSGTISANALAAKAAVEGGRKKQASYEDELIRKRTKFSIFESWYRVLDQHKAIGTISTPEHWRQEPPAIGDVVSVKGNVKTFEIYPLMRMFSDYARNSKIPGHPWYVKGEGAKSISRSAEIMKHIFGSDGEMRIPAHLDLPTGSGDIAFILEEGKLLGSPAPIEGFYTVIGQVAEILKEGDWSPTIRLMPKAPRSEFERETVKSILQGFEEPSEQFGVSNVHEMGEFNGPALVLEPIAVYRG